MTTIDRTKLFDALRTVPGFNGRLIESQVNGTNFILDYFDRKSIDPDFGTYMLATTAWETDKTMLPINEKGGTDYFTKLYDIKGSNPDLARRLGNLTPGDGARYHGRGDVQLTGKGNYAKASDYTGADLVGNPDLACDPKIAVKIMVYGMTTGMFTGKKLSDYFNDNTVDPVGARRIINGTDRATEIANIFRILQTGYRVK